MTTLSHAGSDGLRKTDRAGCLLRLGASQNLQHVGPVEVLVGIVGVGGIVAARGDYEPIVGVDVASLIGSMVAGAGPPSGITSVGARIRAVRVRAVMAIDVRGVGYGIVQQMGDGGLATTTGGVPHGPDFGHGVVLVGVGAPETGFALIPVLLSRSLAFSGSGLRGGRAGLALPASGFEASRRIRLARGCRVRCRRRNREGLAQQGRCRGHGRRPGKSARGFVGKGRT